VILSPKHKLKPYYKKKRAQETSYTLPPEAWLNIFSCMGGLQNLLRCRLVSKHWHQLVDRMFKFINHSYNTGVTNQVLQNVLLSSVLKSVRVLNLAGCDKITDSGLDYLDKMENLEILDLSYCKKLRTKDLLKLAA